MLLAVTLGRSGDGHCRTRRRYPIRCLRLTNSSVILGLTRNASLHVRDSVRSYAPYTQKTLAFRVLFYKECEQIASAYAWSGARKESTAIGPNNTITSYHDDGTFGLIVSVKVRSLGSYDAP